jgi:hypothetical protein
MIGVADCRAADRDNEAAVKDMQRLRFSIGSGPGDFMPLVIGAIFLFISTPGFVLLLIEIGDDFGGLDLPVLAILGAGMILGLVFVVHGLRLCSEPGSLLYRLSHGRIFR